MAGLGPDRTVWADELGLAAREQHGLGSQHQIMEPAGRGIGANDGNAVAMSEELLDPGQMTVATTERRIDEHAAVPRSGEPIVNPGIDRLRRHPMTRTW